MSNIRELLPVLEMTFQAEQLKMAHIASRIAELRKQLIDIERPKRGDPMSVATKAGADVLWETWVKGRKALINQELALAFREREFARGKLIATLSKLEAARQMERRATKMATQAAARRVNW